MGQQPLRVAWISYFPVEWLPDLPEPLRGLPKLHPAPWQRVLVKEFQGRSEIKLDILVVRKHFPHHFTFESGGATIHCLKAPRSWRRPSLFWIDTFLIGRCLKRVQPDLVHAWGTEDGAALIASRLRLPFLVTVQGIMEWCLQVMRKTLDLRLAVVLERIALRRCRTVTAESKFSVSFLRQHYPHLDVHHVDVVPDPVFSQVERRPELRPPRFIFVGALHEPKGADLLLRSLKSLNTEFRVTIVGRPLEPFQGRIRAEIGEELWSRIDFKQNLTSAQMAAEFTSAAMLVCPTRVDTGPMVAKEAALAGVPVVGSATGGMPDYILHGKNGLLFPSGDLKGCCAALQEALKHPLFGRGEVDSATLTRVRDQLAPVSMAGRFFELYRKLVGRK